MIKRFFLKNGFISVLLWVSTIYILCYEIGVLQAKHSDSYLIPVGNFFVKIAYSVLSGIILYFFVDFAPRIKERELAYNYISRKNGIIHRRIIDLFKQVLNHLKRSAASLDNDKIELLEKEILEKRKVKYEINKKNIELYHVNNLDELDIFVILSLIDFNKKTTFSEHTDWFEFFNYYMPHLRNPIEDIIEVVIYVYPEHLKLLMDIYELPILKNRTREERASPIEWESDYFYQLLEFAKKLEKFNCT